MGIVNIDLKLAQQRLTIHYDIANITDENLPIVDAMPRFLETICTHLGWAFGEMWSFNPDSEALIWQTCWHNDSELLVEFTEKSRSLTFNKGVGLPGKVWANAKPTWIEDISQHKDFVRRAAAIRTGLHTAFGCPIWVSGEIVGVINFFSHHIQSPDSGMIDTFGAIGIQIGNYCQRKRVEEAAFKMQRILNQGSQIAHLGIWEWDIPTGKQQWSAENFRIFGYDSAESPPTYEMTLALFHKDRSRVTSAFNDALAGKTPYDIECQIRLPSGQMKFLHCQGEVYRDADGKPQKMLGTSLDITERKKADEQFRLWSELFKNSGEAILVTNPKGTILTVNDAFVRMSGYAVEEVIGQNPRLFKSDRHDLFFFKNMWTSLLETGYWQGEVWDKRKNGELYPKWSTISRIKDDHNQITHFVATYNDITERKATEEQIRYLAHYDPLTGLPNRTLLNDRVAAAISRAKRDNLVVAILFIDLDRFKIVNDSLGHQAGDQLLQQVATGIQGCLRESDTVGRMGGDEFVVLLSEVADIRSIAAIAEKVGEKVVAPMVINEVELRVTASIGISIYPDDGTDQDTLMKNADVAMYYAKENGRNNYHFFTEDLNRVVSNRLLVENNLRQALENNEFVLYYQPQVDVARNEVIGLEALIRWQKPGEGLLGPATFIPIAEETGLIIPLGDWLLQEVCRQFREWNAKGLPSISIAINISAVQFASSTFCEKMITTVQEFGVNPSFLEIEITEGVVMKDAPAAIERMSCLKRNGFKLSIDDFGTGYSSLNYLSRFPIDKLKVDQSFIRTMLSSPIDMAIVETVIALGRNLKVKVVAEGVETAEEAAALKSLGCDQIQGYYYARPMPADAFIAWWLKQSLPAQCCEPQS